jgi:GNAT superfamily N-acetyltransferase
MPVAIGYLADYPEFVPILGGWFYDEWGHQIPNSTAAHFARALQERLQRDGLPLALIAMEADRPVGTVSLILHEVDIRPEYTCWLGSLFVHPRRRGEGIGSLLVRSAEFEASRLQIRELYLYTRQARTEALYLRLGWLPIERPLYRARPAVIMRKRLAPE